MPLSNATSAMLAGTPYWDDYDATKGFYRILNRPKFPVQTRELNQVQSIFQNQVEQLATSMYQEGAAVTGGEQVYANNVQALQVIKTDTVDITNFYSTTTGRGGVVRGVTSGAEAKVLQVSTQPNESTIYAAIIISSLNDLMFLGGEAVTITFGENVYTMTAAPAEVLTRPAAIFSVREGVYFLMGHLVHVPQQTVVLSTSSDTPSARIGFEVASTIVTPETDASLFDPALNTTNYAAPGAHRLKITATLAFRAIDTASATQVSQNASENFVEIARVGGVIAPATDAVSVVLPNERGQLPPITEDVLARRTYDESGDYVVRPFAATATNHYPPSAYPNGIGRISGNTNSPVIINASATAFTSQVDTGDILIVNGEQRRVVTVTNNSQLIINAAFSVDFANSAFSFIDDDKLNLELSAGKAYIRGYEYETLGTTKLEVPRARTTADIDNGQVSTYFGPSVQIKRANGMFNVAATERVDLHCVNYADVKNSTSVVYGASRIGTARVRSQVYVTGNGDANTLYRLYLTGTEFETKTYQINTSATSSDTNLTSVLTVNQSTNSITLTQNIATGYGSNTWIFPQTANAFMGSTVRLYSIDGETLYYDVVQSTFANAVTAQAASVTLTFSAAGLMDRINTSANVVVSFNEKSIRGFATSNTKAVGATVANESRLGLIASGNTVMGGSEYSSMLFKMREDWISPTSIAEEYFSSVYRFSGHVSSASNATHATYVLTAPTGATFPAVTTSLGHTIFTVSNATSAVSLSGAAVTLNGDRTVATLDILISAVGTSATITVLGKIEVASNTATTSVRRTKIFRAGNTTGRTVNATGYLVSNTSGGQIAINNATPLHANVSFRVVGLGVTDAVTLQRVYAVTNANAVITNTSAYIDVTERYDLDTGQRNWCYDHAALVLKPGYMHYTANQMLVVVDMFTHAGANGYFTANSYTGIDYGDIPNFTDPETGKIFPLRDYIDFRPTRQEDLVAANTVYVPYVGANQTFNTQAFYPHPDETFQMDYSHYLGRVDKIVLTVDRELKVIPGLPSVTPVPPSDPEQSMTLYIVTYPPYTANAELVQIEAVEHRRYTMRDIGRLEKRIGQLEYYVQLSQLEDRTLANPELDEDDVERFKNGILIDPFSSHAIANVDDDDYHASIDENKRELRPAFVSQGLRLGSWRSDQSTNVIRGGVGATTNNIQEEVGQRIFPTYTTRSFISQVLATKSLNLNPFSTAFWQGNVKLNPATDVWFDTVRDPKVSLNLYNENDNWSTKTFGTVWNDWQTIFKGTPKTETERADASSVLIPFVSGVRNDWTEIALNSLVTRQDTVENRTASTITAKASKKITEILDRVVDTTIVPSMRLANIAFVATGLKPGTTLRATFDEIDVTNYVERANEIRLTSNADAQTFIVGETVTGKSNLDTNTIGSGRIIAITGNTLRVGNVEGRFFDGATNETTVTASLSSLRDTPHTPVVVSEYVSYAGLIQGVTNSTTFILDTGASAVNDAYADEVVYITTGPGAGQRTTITSYDGASKTVTVSPALATLPTTASRYSIGSVKADPITPISEMSYNTPSISSRMPGAAYGMFFLPGYGHITSSTSLQRNPDTREITGVTYAPINFGIGRRVFRLSDASSIDEATTYAEAVYESAGQTKIIQTDVLNTKGLEFTVVPPYSREGSLVATTVDGLSPLVENRPQLSLNPVAQTFVVDRNLYPSGLYVTSVDLFFTRSDEQRLPVFVRLSPTLNGFPATDVILGSVVRHNVNVVPTNTAPNAANPEHYTRFTFANPVYLQAGVEYALVVSTPSAEYEVMVSELGRNAIGTSNRVSEQPYVHSLFRSQNSRIWKPQPVEDLTFVLHRAVFSTEQATGVFELNEKPKFQPYGGRGLSTYANGVFEFDLYNVDTGHIDFAETITNSSYQLRLLNLNDTQTVVTTKINQNLPVLSRAKIQNTDSVQFTVSFKTNTDSIAPMYDTSRFNIVAVQNLIDNGQLYANGVTIVNPGQLTGNSITNPYFSNTINAVVTGVTATGTTCGSGGVLTFTVNSLGQVSSVVVATNGSGYLESLSINNTSDLKDDGQVNTVSWLVNPVFVYRGETSSSVNIFGERKSRYITRRVNLADEFDAADLKVYLSANRPPEANIDVYYKVLANGDRESFDDKNWVRMLLRDSQQNVFSANDREFKEYEYRTIANTAAYVSNSVEYTRFQSFAVKIVLRSTNTIRVPRVRNLRAIALDS